MNQLKIFQNSNEIEEALWDGDNTLWVWLEYAVEAYEAMAQKIADLSGKPEPEVAAAMKKFYTEVGTLEHEGLIQWLDAHNFFTGVKGYDMNHTILEAQKAFSTARHRNIHVLKGMQKIVRIFDKKGIKNSLTTDAPANQGMARLKRSRMTKHFSRVIAMPPAKIENLPEKFRQRELDGYYRIKNVEVHLSETEKPFTDLQTILRMTKKEISQKVIVLGDNDSKDMELARSYGCRGIHLVHNTIKADLKRRIARFAPDDSLRKHTNIAPPTYRESDRIAVVHNVHDIPRIMGWA